ncbi:MAG: alpha/beta fold hydrolase, partial [Dehalococcoidia bacterium]
MAGHSTAIAAWTHGEATVNGVRLHYVEAGSGPLVLLLHGFPEFWYSWRHQIPVLAAAGYHVVAPDMRGYNTSAKPRGVRSYALEPLTGDVLGLIRHFGAERATVVGHDWGGAVAWYVPMRYPDAVERLIVLNAPHPAALMRELHTLDQLRRSWYVFVFQIPWLPEAAVRARGYAMLDRTLRTDPARPDAFSDDDIRRYKRALAQPGALTAAINYYRAAFRRDPRTATRDLRPITCPTLLIWGERDRYLSPRLTEGLDRWVPNLRVERIPDASHWVQVD